MQDDDTGPTSLPTCFKKYLRVLACNSITLPPAPARGILPRIQTYKGNGGVDLDLIDLLKFNIAVMNVRSCFQLNLDTLQVLTKEEQHLVECDQGIH
jgi:hypothetical protein